MPSRNHELFAFLTSERKMEVGMEDAVALLVEMPEKEPSLQSEGFSILPYRFLMFQYAHRHLRGTF
jgi:hypothetical protein